MSVSSAFETALGEQETVHYSPRSLESLTRTPALVQTSESVAPPEPGLGST